MKTQDTYRSIIKGVSQQPPNERLEGQHSEQVNMISDPVHGLVRRNGMVARKVVSKDIPPETALNAAIADSHAFRVFSFSVGANLYDLLYRSRPAVGTIGDAHLDALMVYDKQGAQQFLPVLSATGDTGMADYYEGGFSSIVLIGGILLLAGNTVIPSLTITNKWNENTNLDKGVVYVKTGNYNRKYRIKAKERSTGITADVTYTTPGAAYGGTLVVDDLNPADPDYQFYLNNRIYAYENAQNAWTVSSAQAIVPSAIAEELRLLLVAAGHTSWTRDGNYLHNDDLEYVITGDEDNDALLLAVHNQEESEQALSPRHYAGKVVKIVPVKGSEEAYYMKAATENGEAFGQVTWSEAAGVEQSFTSMVAFATLREDKLLIGSTPANLQAAVLEHTGDTIDVPQFVPSKAGDMLTMPAPSFGNRPITLLALFQDRLVVGAGNVLRLSAQGDYLNFYRPSLLTSVQSGASEDLYAAGTTGDVIRKAALYDRNLTLYGDSYHYVMPGRQAFDPSNPQLSVQYAIEGTGRSQPVSAGDKVFVMKEDTSLAAVQVLQMNPGVWQDSPQVDTISKQLRSYLNGTPAEMVSITSPSILFVRTEFINRSDGAYPLGRPFGLYTYNYMDTPEGRAHESWSAWEWSAALGTPIGIGANTGGDGILLYTVTFNTTATGMKRFVIVQDATARTEPTGLPWIDGIHDPATNLGGLASPDADFRVQQAICTVKDAVDSVEAPIPDDLHRWGIRSFSGSLVGDRAPQAVDPYRWAGAYGFLADWQVQHPGADTLGAWQGFAFEAYVDPTPPFMRNHEDKVRLYGKLILTKLLVNTVRTGGIQGYVAHHSGVDRSLYFDAGYVREPKNHSMFVGRDSSMVNLRLQSVDWHPLTISSIAWQGSWNNNQGSLRRAR